MAEQQCGGAARLVRASMGRDAEQSSLFARPRHPARVAPPPLAPSGAPPRPHQQPKKKKAARPDAGKAKPAAGLRAGTEKERMTWGHLSPEAPPPKSPLPRHRPPVVVELRLLPLPWPTREEVNCAACPPPPLFPGHHDLAAIGQRQRQSGTTGAAESNSPFASWLGGRGEGAQKNGHEFCSVSCLSPSPPA